MLVLSFALAVGRVQFSCFPRRYHACETDRTQSQIKKKKVPPFNVFIIHCFDDVFARDRQRGRTENSELDYSRIEILGGEGGGREREGMVVE